MKNEEDACIAFEKPSEHVIVIRGAVNTGVLVDGGRAVLLNCCDLVTPALLRGLGVERVDAVFCTSYRRAVCAGVYAFEQEGAEIHVPEKEAELFTDAEGYWADPANRWHIYGFMPDTDVLPRSLKRVASMRGGECFRWRGYDITALDAPGNTHGGVAYLVEDGGCRLGFCGDLIMSGGHANSLWQMARATERNMGYHGFMQSRGELIESLRRIAGCCGTLVPAYGEMIADPGADIELLAQRLDAIYRSYAAISAMNHYFPGAVTRELPNAELMEKAEQRELPEFIRYVSATSFAVVSGEGAAFLIDCGSDDVVETLRGWIAEGAIASVDGCWVTHYHDDHVDAIGKAGPAFGCPVLASDCMADILRHPLRWFLPCISPASADTQAVGDGVSWRWREFTFTAYRFPGQSLYHGGLLVEGGGERVFFAGDSGSPTGIDDYCAQNRNFLGEGRGMLRCIDIWKACRPDYIVNEHQRLAFRFDEEQLELMRSNLLEREKLIANLTAWPAADFALDEWWARAYPYEQSAPAGSVVEIGVQFTNHAHEPMGILVEPELPEGWSTVGTGCALLPPRTCGIAGEGFENPDIAVRLEVRISVDAVNGLYCLPLKIWFGGRYLGWYRHALVRVV